MISCSSSNDVAVTMNHDKIFYSEIYDNIGDSTFQAFTRGQKFEFIQKYAIYKYILSSDQNEIAFPGLTVNQLINRIKHDKIILEMEKYIRSQFSVSDSVLEFIGDALNKDVYVRVITVSHQFSFGKTSNRTKEEARKRAENIYKRIYSGELSYEEALSIYGEFAAAKIKGNEMGQIYFGLMAKPFNDRIWTSSMETLLEPIETPIGFHVVIVDQWLPKTGKDKKSFDPNQLAKDLKSGKYGYYEEEFLEFLDTLYKKYDVHLDENEFYRAWDSVKNIEGINTISGININELRKMNDSFILGKIGEKDLTLDWVINEANHYSFYHSVGINNGFSFEKIIRDVIARYLLVRWFEDHAKSFPRFEQSLRTELMNQVYHLYIDKLQKENPDLTKKIILNRIMVKEGIEIQCCP